MRGWNPRCGTALIGPAARIAGFICFCERSHFQITFCRQKQTDKQQQQNTDHKQTKNKIKQSLENINIIGWRNNLEEGMSMIKAHFMKLSKT